MSGSRGNDITLTTVASTSTDHAPVAGDDDYTTPAGIALSVPGPGVLANDTDADSDFLCRSSPGTRYPRRRDGGPSQPTARFTYTPKTGFTGPTTSTTTLRRRDATAAGLVQITVPALQISGHVTSGGVGCGRWR